MDEQKLKQITIPSQLDDTFADFRDIALLDLKHEFNYRHSLGKSSKFFLELAKGKLFATQCPICKTVYMPPRAVCSKELEVTKWIQLSGRGTLESWTTSPYPPTYADVESPYILAYVRLEGTDSLFLLQLRNTEPEQLEFGLEVQIVYGEEASRHPLGSIWFELC